MEGLLMIKQRIRVHGLGVVLPGLAAMLGAGADPTRSDWEPVRIQVPIHQTQHQTTFRHVPVYVDETARQRGDYPDVQQALRTNDVGADQWAEAATEVASPAISLVLVPTEWLSGNGPWAAQAGPDGSYGRLPAAQLTPLADRNWFLPENE
ncbi:MAG: hypothetical protein ACYTGG_08575 [Planctomycetota bacterium]|jgi:hypothetical protein